MNYLQNNQSAQRALYLLLSLFSVALFLKNAWAAEDAFILLRSVDQFLHGNGFRWNPHERAQVYTSPLWFLLVIASTAFCKTLYINVIGLSLALHIALLACMAAIIKNVWRWSATVLLLTLSQSFFDFTASGLEYPLVYFLLGIFVLLYLRNLHKQDRYWLAGSAGLALITRHDLLFLLAPMLLHLCWYFYQTLSRRHFLTWLCVFLTPLTCWTVFSLLYYGFPFPNTAYAKLAITGVSQLDRFRRGYIYAIVSLQTDPITPMLLAIASLQLLREKQTRFKMLGASIFLAFCYVSWIGGDYMIGRFYSPIYLAAILGLTTQTTFIPLSGRLARCLLVIPTGQLLYWFLVGNSNTILRLLETLSLPAVTTDAPVLLLILTTCLALAVASWRHPKTSVINVIIFTCLLFYSTQQNDSPWRTPYKNWGKTADQALWWMINTVTRERYWIFRWTSLNSWAERDPDKAFPDHPWCNEGKVLDSVSLVRFSGMMPYCMGTEKIAIDIMGLTDPLMARMPKNPGATWTSGGANRLTPDGYLSSLVQNANLIVDPDLAHYYDKVRLITQSDDLFSQVRLRTIVAMNLGFYDHWLNSYKQRALQNAPAPPG